MYFLYFLYVLFILTCIYFPPLFLFPHFSSLISLPSFLSPHILFSALLRLQADAHASQELILEGENNDNNSDPNLPSLDDGIEAIGREVTRNLWASVYSIMLSLVKSLHHHDL